MAKQNNTIQQDTNFLFEMGNLRYIDRMWRRLYSKDFANLAEHHFRTLWIAMTIATHEGADLGKVAKIALVHDITESRVGDVDYLSRQYVERNEELAIKDMLAGTALEKEFVELWEEYEKRESIEAKIVKDADNLDVDFELAEQAVNGNPLQKLWKGNRDFVAKEKLYTKTAKKMAEQLSKTNPHTWHLEGRNRRNGGDWQK
ncbi:MAG: HD domain-containing protein [Pseudomonadales bacterium]|jgi:putative hydrolase of HD superfamily|nr:HD domain-containing protein [Pseudomonadales bacterium]